MEKSIYTREYALFLRLLRQTRKDASLTQVQMAQLLRQTQSFVSKCERGERRLDIVELRAFCEVMGIQIDQFVQQLEQTIRQTPSPEESRDQR